MVVGITVILGGLLYIENERKSVLEDMQKFLKYVFFSHFLSIFEHSVGVLYTKAGQGVLGHG